jgi:8-oxo-dGTP pyrophosphatase MutT (NUDIX family)
VTDFEVLAALERALLDHQPSRIAGNFIEAAVMLAITKGGTEPSLIVTRRAAHLNLHAGESAFPGGKHDAQDSSLLQTALREAWEEVALEPRQFRFIGELDQQLTSTGIRVSPFVGVVSDAVALSANLAELDSIFKVPLAFLVDRSNLQFTPKIYPQGTINVPNFIYGEYSVWGATARMVIELMNKAFDARLPLTLDS